jgi:hypothetical protein
MLPERTDESGRLTIRNHGRPYTILDTNQYEFIRVIARERKRKMGKRSQDHILLYMNGFRRERAATEDIIYLISVRSPQYFVMAAGLLT